MEAINKYELSIKVYIIITQQSVNLKIIFCQNLRISELVG